MKVVKIEKVVFGGDGLAKDEGLVVFVPFTIEGETVSVEVTKRHKNFERGRVLQVITPSSQRRTAPCPYFGTCGGCQLQHMSYQEQLRTKEKQLQELFPCVLPIVPAPHPFYYRKRISPRYEQGQFGFTSIDNHTFVPVSHCLLFSDKPLKDIPHFKEEGPFLIKNLSIEVTSAAFCQNYPEQSRHLYLYIEKLIAEHKPSIITDLYSGVGITSLLGSAHAKHVYGVELNQEAVKFAQMNAKKNGIKNVSFKAQKAENALLKGPLLLLNPPRTGVDPLLLNKINQSDVRTIIYTSCNPATLARDIKRLENFELQSCQPFDMFPQTAHVEVVAVLYSNSLNRS